MGARRSKRNWIGANRCMLQIQAEHIEELKAHRGAAGAKYSGSCTSERSLIAASKWIRLGRKLNVGPVVARPLERVAE